MKTDDVDSSGPSADEVRATLRISCADAGVLLSDYREGVLLTDDADRIAAHLANCLACGVILDQLEVTVTLLGQVGSHRDAPGPDEVDRFVTQALLAARR